MPDIPEPLDISPVDDTEELDFLNHPSYHDRGGINNNRRRRRRLHNEPAAREELISKGSPRPPVLQLKSESIAEADSVSSAATQDLVASTAMRDAVASKELAVIGRSSGLEPAERVGKPQLIKSPKEIEPPQVISIEMTPEEQDVYALMGISPLVRLNREIKNPKSVILSVLLPGEAPQIESSNEVALESDTEAPMESLASDEAQISEMVSVTSSAEAPVTEIATEPTPTGELESNSTLIRRRRRRSSAENSTAF